MNGRFKINGNFAKPKRKFFNDNIDNIEIEIIKRNYFNNLHNNYSVDHHFDFRPQDFNRYRNSNIDYTHVFRSDPQPSFSQNYNVPTKKLFLNNEQASIKYSKRKNQYSRSKNNIKNREIFNDAFREYRIDKSFNENKNEIELEHINPNKIISSPPAAAIDENLIKQDLHRTQTNKKPSSLYENFIKSATKKETKVEKVETLEINLSSLSLSSNETTSVSSKENFKNYRSNIFENNSGLKKSLSFGNKVSNDGLSDGKISNNNNIFNGNKSIVNEKALEKKKTRKRNRWRKDAKKTEMNVTNEEFDFSTTNEFWEEDSHLVIGHDYLTYDSDVDINFDFDLDFN